MIARFVEGLRQANGIIAGITGMHWTKFVPFNMLGAALWVGVWVSIGYFSGSNIDSIYRTATKYEAVLRDRVGVLILAWIAHRVWKHREGAASESGRARAGPDRTEPTEPERTSRRARAERANRARS